MKLSTNLSISFVVFMVFKCITANGVVSFGNSENKSNNGNTCKNSVMMCGEQKTCCETKNGGYQCCQYENAICCEDNLHCCPGGTTCDSKNKRCIPQTKEPMEWPLIEATEASKIESPLYTVETSSISELLMKIGVKYVCPNGSVCPGYQSCCLGSNGKYNCCPVALGICCPDRVSCCRHGQRCVPGGCL